MTIAELIELALHHEEQASRYESAADAATPFVTPHVSACCRELAQWHASTAIKLRELAESFKASFTAATA